VRGLGFDFGQHLVAGREQVVEVVVDVGLRDVSVVTPAGYIRCGRQVDPQKILSGF
jgi:hypothetical protein